MFNGPDADLESLTEFLSYVGMTSRPNAYASSQRIRRLEATLASQVEANESLQPSREKPRNRTRVTPLFYCLTVLRNLCGLGVRTSAVVFFILRLPYEEVFRMEAWNLEKVPEPEA